MEDNKQTLLNDEFKNLEKSSGLTQTEIVLPQNIIDINEAFHKLIGALYQFRLESEQKLSRREMKRFLKYIETFDSKRYKNVVKWLRSSINLNLEHLIQFKLPHFQQYYTNSGNDWYKRSGLYAASGNVHTDRRLYHVGRRTQGYMIPFTYIAEATTAVATAFSTYLMYKSGKNIYQTIDAQLGNLSGLDLLSFVKDNMMYLIAILTTLCLWYKGEIGTTSATFQILGVLAAAKIFSSGAVVLTDLVSTAMSILKPFPANSTHRETQGFEPTTLAEGLISVLLLFGLGTAPPNSTTSKTIMQSIKGFSATILTVKTVESVFVQVINYLPDIFHAMICEYIPAFGLYVALTTDKTFRKFIEVTSELRNATPNEVFYNSHNLSRFLRMREYCMAKLCSTESIKKRTHYLISDIIDWYDIMYEWCDKLGLVPGRRKMPFVIWLSGDPGIGKSTLVHELSREVLKILFGEPGNSAEFDNVNVSQYIYSHSTANKYFDGYNNQPIFILNDYLQFSSENEEQWLIRFTDTTDCPLEVSSVDNIVTGVKGEVRFTSRVIIVTSNISHLYNSTCITNLDAFNRRRDVVLQMNWADDKQTVNLENFDYSWCNFKLRNSVPTAGEIMIPLQSKRAVFSYIRKRIVPFLQLNGIGDIPFEEFKTQTSIRSNLNKVEKSENEWNDLISKVWSSVTYYLDKTMLGIKFKYLIPLTLVGSTAYMIYKSWIPTLLDKFTHSLSGDMATQKIQKKLKPLVRTTMGNRQNDTELGVKLMNNVVKITTIIDDPHGKAMSQTMWGWSSGGSFIITPKHLWCRGNKRVRDGDSVRIKRGDKEFEFYTNSRNVYLFENDDIAVVNVLGFMPPFRNISNLIVDGSIGIDEAGEEILLIMPTENNGTLIPVLIPMKAYLTNAPYVDEYGTVYEGRNIWQYNHKMMKGDCGAIMCLKTKNGMKIAGMHVAGDSFSGNSEVISTYMLKEAEDFFLRKETQGFTTDMEIDDDHYFDAESDLEGNFFFLGKVKNPPYQKSETQIVRSPLYEALQPHTTEPAVLSPTDKRMEKIISPILQSVSKYGQHIPPFDKKLMDEAYDIVVNFYESIAQHDLKVYSANDAINSTFTPNLEKLDLSTSAGYPWNTRGLTKADLIDKSEDGILTIKPELDKVIQRNEKLLLKKTMFPYTLVTTLKDERVSLKKVKIGKTRTFMNFPVEYTILLRKYFDDFIDKETLHAMEIGTTVGVNIYSNNWHDLFLMLNKFDYVTDGDFKSFDGSIRPEFFKYYAHLVNSMYKDENSNIRDMLCTGCCFAPIFVLDKVYMKLQGNPSGSRLTTSFNSFVNRMYVVMSMLSVLPKHFSTRQFFKDNVKIFAHGDDHIIGFSSIVRDFWDALVLQKFMRRHNIDYTSSNKDEELRPHRKLYDCYYLKSHFVFNRSTGKYQAGLDKEVIQEMVSWQRDNKIESTDMIVQTCLRYAYFWGRQYFEEIRNQLSKSIKEKHLPISLVDFNSLEQYYLYNGQMDFSYV